MKCEAQFGPCPKPRECVLKGYCIDMKKRKPNYGKQVDGERMRELATLLQKELPGLGFALITFELGDDVNKLTNYISNGKREDMKNALEEVLNRWKNGTGFMTPNNN